MDLRSQIIHVANANVTFQNVTALQDPWLSRTYRRQEVCPQRFPLQRLFCLRFRREDRPIRISGYKAFRVLDCHGDGEQFFIGRQSQHQPETHTETDHGGFK